MAGSRIYVTAVIVFIITAKTLICPDNHLMADQPLTLVYAGASPSTGFTTIGMERWKTQVLQRTGGMVSIVDAPEQAQQTAASILEAVLSGQADVGCAGLLPGSDHLFAASALALPLDIPDAQTGSAVFMAFYNKYRLELSAQFKILTLFTSAPANLVTTVPVEKPEAIEGVDLHATGTTAGLLSAWHANPVNIPPEHRLEALEKGVIKGLLTSLEALKEMELAAHCRYVTRTDTMVYPFVVVMNQSRWNLLPDTVKQVMDGLMEEQSQWIGRYIDHYVKEAVDWSIRLKNVEIMELSEKQKAPWNQRLFGISDSWVEKAEARQIDGKEMLAALHQMIAQQRHQSFLGE